MTPEENDLSLALATYRVSLLQADKIIASARGVLTDKQVDEVIAAREHALRLFHDGRRDAAFEAGNTFFEKFRHLYSGLLLEKPLRVGRKVIAGGQAAAKKTNAQRSADIRALVVAAIAAYKGDKRSMAGKIAKKCHCTARYVREIKKELSLS